MTELLDLCYDVLIRILEEVEPEDLAACAQTSWAFHNFLEKNARLYKTHYLKNYDDPRVKPADAEPNWVEELQKLVKCRKILQSTNQDVKDSNFNFVASTIDSLISKASSQQETSLTTAQLSPLFGNPQNLDAFLYRSSLYGRAGTSAQKAASTEKDRQLSAKIHCLYGIPTTTAGRRALSTHPYARSRVYDLRGYTDANKWGPFRNDGSMHVDWEKVESLMVVLGYNSGLCCRRFLHRFRAPWSEPFEGVIPEKSTVLPEYPLTLVTEPEVSLEMKDPYGVSGVWSRIVCFLDYNDLFHFNFSSESALLPPDQPRDPIITEEAIRHIMMRLYVTKVETPGPSDGQALPVVHFSGKSRSVDASWDPNANSKIRGSVRLTPDGEVRWTTISIFYGEERWRSEGVQPGGPRSLRGVVGTWFDKDHDPHGPAGPTAFWKVAELTDEEEVESDGEDGHWLH
ncbi:hypothetical protein K458DRAFT_88548 [Lentithecium fluviatile CBS 122367]|uniref:F-box domain-containing protein n=1 Tax=Lentithecium fluviatile CBS 122367 TaxID=1168545 RepID=A0A6G1IRX3_9PLEO|nr:hypothetical protein K458DRAFT_88548 [Lentithecium fluviatile CBS 122367]